MSEGTPDEGGSAEAPRALGSSERTMCEQQWLRYLTGPHNTVGLQLLETGCDEFGFVGRPRSPIDTETESKLAIKWHCIVMQLRDTPRRQWHTVDALNEKVWEGVSQSIRGTFWELCIFGNTGEVRIARSLTASPRRRNTVVERPLSVVATSEPRSGSEYRVGV